MPIQRFLYVFLCCRPDKQSYLHDTLKLELVVKQSTQMAEMQKCLGELLRANVHDGEKLSADLNSMCLRTLRKECVCGITHHTLRPMRLLCLV